MGVDRDLKKNNFDYIVLSGHSKRFKIHGKAYNVRSECVIELIICDVAATIELEAIRFRVLEIVQAN